MPILKTLSGFDSSFSFFSFPFCHCGHWVNWRLFPRAEIQIFNNSELQQNRPLCAGMPKKVLYLMPGKNQDIFLGHPKMRDRKWQVWIAENESHNECLAKSCFETLRQDCCLRLYDLACTWHWNQFRFRLMRSHDDNICVIRMALWKKENMLCLMWQISSQSSFPS